MSYKMILNILILFLCTSCCACKDCDPDVDIFYLRIVEDGQNAVLKYDIEDSRNYEGNNNLRLAYFKDDAQNRVYARTYVEGNSTNSYLAISFERRMLEGKVCSLWLANKEVGKFFIKSKSTKKTFDCCGSSKIEAFESRTDSVIVIKEDKNFYAIQF